MIPDKPLGAELCGYYAGDEFNEGYHWFKRADKNSLVRHLGQDGYGMDKWNTAKFSKDFYEGVGFSFPILNDEKKEETMTITDAKTLTRNEFIDRLLDYVAEKPVGRLGPLRDMIKEGVLDDNATPDRIVQAVRTSLTNNPNVCTEGRNRAFKALGILPETHWVKKVGKSGDAFNYLRSSNKHKIRLGSSAGTAFGYTCVYATKGLANIPSNTVIEYWVEEEV